jgi:branched-chain amino acid transport system permease protein
MTQGIQSIVDALSVGSTYALLALGLTLVFSVMRLINFAYGIMLVGGAYLLLVAGNAGWPFLAAAVLCVVGVTALSMIVGRIAFRPFIGAPPTTLLITSFAVLLILQYGAILLFGEGPRTVPIPTALRQSFVVGDVVFPAVQLVTIAVSAVVILAFYWLLERTMFGAELRAAAELPDVARLVGLSPNRILMLAFGISGVIAGVAAVLWFSKVGTVTPRSDLLPTLKAFIAIVLGGIGSIRGSVVGGLALGAIEVSMALALPQSALVYSQAIVFMIVIALLLVRPGGLAGGAAQGEAA